MLQAIVWLLIIELIGFLALPATFAFFRFLPDRGYAFSKTFGLLGGGFVVWFLGMIGLPFTALTSWLLPVLLFGGLGFWLLRRNQGQLRSELDDFFRKRLGLMIALELLFIVAYFYLVNMRSFMPEIRDQEKFGDFAFLNSMVLHDKLPPADPWMSGYTINYYYFSHFLMAMLTKMSGVAPYIAFNLTVPLIFGLTAIGGFGIIYNLVTVARSYLSTQHSALSTRYSSIAPAILAGLLAAAGICILGNLDSARQVLFPVAGQPTFAGFNYNWWSPSRVISDFQPQPIGNGFYEPKMTETITEFPMFSFLLADMHPHVMTLPFVLLVVAAALGLLLAPAGASLLNLRTGEGRYFFLGLALMVGSLYVLNTWDFPTYLLVVALAALVRELRLGKQELTEDGVDGLAEAGKAALLGGNISPEPSGLGWRRAARWLGFCVRLGVVSLALYLPFHLTFTSLLGDTYVPDAVNLPILSTLAKNFLVVAWDRTPLISQTIVQVDGQEVVRWGYLMVFGIFLYPILCLLALKLWPYLKAPYAYLDQFEAEGREISTTSTFGSFGYGVAGFGLVILLFSEVMSFSHASPVLTLIVGLMSVPLIGIGVGMLAAEYLARVRLQRPAQNLLIALGSSAALMIALGWILNFQLYGPLLLLFICASLLAWFESKSPEFRVQSSESRVPSPELEEANPQSSALSTQHSALGLSQADQFVLLLVALPALITFTIEIIFLRDIFNARLNTIFKFYYQAWVMYALAAAYATWRVVAWGWKLAPYKEENEAEEVSGWDAPRPSQKAPVFRPQASLWLNAAGANGANIAFTTFSSPPALEPEEADDLIERDEAAEAAEEYAERKPKKAAWRWVWALGLLLLLMAGLIYPLFGPYEKSGHFQDRKGLDGEAWLEEWYPEDYAAIKWMREQAARDKSFEGPVLETTGPDWYDYNRVGTFSGFPILMGWPGHEFQWRGGKASTRDEVSRRIQDIDTIYSTPDVEQARSLLQKYGVKYVFVGTIETGTRDGRYPNKKNYPPESLAKFRTFMKPIYNQNGVTIYSFS
jgi:YYY domain-containing protein